MMKVTMLLLLALACLTSCSGGNATYIFYVVTKPAEAEQFIAEVAAFAKEDDLQTATSQTQFNNAGVLRVLEGRGHGLKIWVQSAPLSGHEDPILCGVYHEPHPDPAQFVVFTVPGLLGTTAEAAKLGARVFSQLRNAGYGVHMKPPICGAAALHDRS